MNFETFEMQRKKSKYNYNNITTIDSSRWQDSLLSSAETDTDKDDEFTSPALKTKK